MRRAILGLLATLAFAAPAGAVVVRDCDSDPNTASAQNLLEPWEKNTKTFYNGEVRVALIDTGGEPACCSLHLLVLNQVVSDLANVSACHLISDHDNFGFGNIDIAKLTGHYDPKKGLLITFPFIVNNGDDVQKPGVAKLRLNMAKGTIAVEH
jgi:hypothetical protein